VEAHADDRDVFVLQLFGTKSWRVYPNPPIFHPYAHEQVGKNGLPVPLENVLNATPVIERVLNPGDVLYMPRGWVHEASCHAETESLHVTFAVGTAESSTRVVVKDLIRSLIDESALGRTNQDVESDVMLILEAVKTGVSADKVIAARDGGIATLARARNEVIRVVALSSSRWQGQGQGQGPPQESNYHFNPHLLAHPITQRTLGKASDDDRATMPPAWQQNFNEKREEGILISDTIAAKVTEFNQLVVNGGHIHEFYQKSKIQLTLFLFAYCLVDMGSFRVMRNEVNL